ncbi:MAG: thiamine pyrophosphate-binding protein, partial [Halobaculum sp.]
MSDPGTVTPKSRTKSGAAADDESPAEVETEKSSDREQAESETGADAVVAALERGGVDHLFGVQGGAIMPVYDALYDA